MSESVINSLTQGISQLLIDHVFPSIVKGLSSRVLNTSVEEIINITNIRTTKSTPKKNSKDNPLLHGTCKYRFVRGKKKEQGLVCGRPVDPGQDYCNLCLKTHKKLKRNPIPPMINTSEIPVIEQTVKREENQNDEPQSIQLDVTVYDESKGLYRELKNNFIIHQVDQSYVVIGRLDETENKIVKLDDNDKEIVKHLGLNLVEEPEKKSPKNLSVNPLVIEPLPSISEIKAN
ncbi:MAG: hypothetical protein QW303_07085 [Nitrososphaerota archaeon]